MLGFVLIYFIGKQFYDLALEHNKNEWVYAILGVVAYYLGTFLGGIIIVVGALLLGYNVDKMNETALSFLAIPFGLAFCGLVYYVMKKNMNKVPSSDVDLLDDGL